MTRDAVMVRFPEAILAHGRRAKRDRSLNDFVVSSVGREAEYRRTLATLDQIDALRRRIADRTGVQPDSTPLIRAWREGRAGR